VFSFLCEKLCKFSSLIFIIFPLLTIGVEFGISEGIQRTSDLVYAFIILLIGIIAPVVDSYSDLKKAKQVRDLNDKGVRNIA